MIPDRGDLVFLVTDFYRSRDFNITRNARVGVRHHRLISFRIVLIGYLTYRGFARIRKTWRGCDERQSKCQDAE